MSPPLSITDRLRLADANWETLANALESIADGVEGEDAAAKKLRAQLGLARMLIYEEIRGWNGSNIMNVPFFIGTYKTMEKLQKEFDNRGIKKREFIIFLELLLYKLEKQRILVKKPLETLGEFRKMKGVIEHGYDPL